MSDSGETRFGKDKPQPSRPQPTSVPKPVESTADGPTAVSASGPTTSLPEPVQSAGVDEQQVVSFLTQRPDFFSHHPELLMALDIPHAQTSGASSLLEYQADVLRDKNRDLNRKLKQLVAIAGENQQLMERVHRLVLRLMACETKQQLLAELRQRLERDFGAQALSVCLFSEDTDGTTIDGLLELSRSDSALAPFEDFLSDLEPLCGRLKSDKLNFLFGEQAGQVQSSVLLPLDRDGEVGMLAIGSDDGNRFYPGMGTEFLRLIGEVLGRHLNRAPRAGERLRA